LFMTRFNFQVKYSSIHELIPFSEDWLIAEHYHTVQTLHRTISNRHNQTLRSIFKIPLRV
jgi:hypothetical protein